MPKQSEIDRMLVLLYRSNNAHGYTNYCRPANWLDKLPMVGMLELSSLLSHMKADVEHEIEQRKIEGIDRYSREWHETVKGRKKLSNMLGVDFNNSF